MSIFDDDSSWNKMGVSIVLFETTKEIYYE